MRKKGEQKIGTCTYCGKIGPITKDHIPPKFLFNKPRPSTLISVPSCEKCHETFEKDDVYFTTIITTTKESQKHPEALKLWNTKIKPSISRDKNIGFSKYLFNRMVKVDTYSKGGIYLGETPAHNIDIDRINNVLIRIVRGLYYHETNNRIPTGVDIRVNSIRPEKISNKKIMLIYDSFIPKVFGDGVFSYRGEIFSEKSFTSVWFLTFFDAFLFLGFTLPSDNFEQLKN